MDQTTKLEIRVAELERKAEFLARQLDETRRRIGLSPILDDQVLAINSRQQERGTAA